jgi:microcin C transport system permease protein
MAKYILRRILLMIPTLLGITMVCFLIINLAPGSPVEQKIAQIRFSAASGGAQSGAASGSVSQEQIETLKKQYGFDKPLHIRYLLWLKNICRLNFGTSFAYETPVTEVILDKLPVSLQFGISSALLIYLISIPVGIAKATRDGSRFDVVSSIVLMVMYSTPPLILGILLRVYLAGGHFISIFPLGELYSDRYREFSMIGKIGDRLMHFILPLTCYVVNGFTVLSLLMKNSLLEEIKLDYVRTARAKGLEEKSVINRHALRNALIPILTGLGSFLTVFFGGSIIIESVFNLDGMGLLGYKSILSRDYNVIMGLIFIQAVISMIGRLVSDITYVIADPRIDFE